MLRQVLNFFFIVYFIVCFLPRQYFILLDLVGIGLIDSADGDRAGTVVDNCVRSHFVFNIWGSTLSILFTLLLFLHTDPHQRIFFNSSGLSGDRLTQFKLLLLFTFDWRGARWIHQTHELVLRACENLKQLCGKVNVEVIFAGYQIKYLPFIVLEDVFDFSLFNEWFPFA